MSVALFAAFSGGVANTVSLPADTSVFDNFGTDNPTYAGIWLDSDGTVSYYTNTGGLTSLGNWFSGYTGSELWTRCTFNSGTGLDAGSDATGSWLSNSIDRDWFCQDTSSLPTAKTANITLEVSTDSSGSPVVDSQTYTISANYDTS